MSWRQSKKKTIEMRSMVRYKWRLCLLHVSKVIENGIWFRSKSTIPLSRNFNFVTVIFFPHCRKATTFFSRSYLAEEIHNKIESSSFLFFCFRTEQFFFLFQTLQSMLFFAVFKNKLISGCISNDYCCTQTITLMFNHRLNSTSCR